MWLAYEPSFPKCCTSHDRQVLDLDTLPEHTYPVHMHRIYSVPQLIYEQHTCHTTCNSDGDCIIVLAGQLVTALWVVIPRLYFANSCLATVFYSVGMVMVSQNGHIGSRLKAMVVIPGAWWVGSVCGGFTVSLPQPIACCTTCSQRLLLCVRHKDVPAPSLGNRIGLL